MAAKMLDPGLVLNRPSAANADDRSDCYRFLAGLILDDPTTALLEGLSSGEIADLLAGTLEGAGVELAVAGLETMRDFLDGRRGVSPEEVKRELSVARTRLFRGISGEFGPPPPYEVLHRAREATTEGEFLLRLLRFYREAAVGLPDGYVERPDYLGLELDLMGSLCTDESVALSRGDAGATEQARTSQRSFLEQHLLRWVPTYCQLLAREAGCGYYVGAAKLLEGFLSSEAALFDIRQGRSTD